MKNFGKKCKIKQIFKKGGIMFCRTVEGLSRCRLIIALMMFLIFNSVLIAGDGYWSTTGPYGGKVIALKTDPNDPNIIYCGTFHGSLFKSTDGGQTWFAINNGLTTPTSNIYSVIYDIQIDPVNSNILYVARWAGGIGGVFKSIDGGSTWQPTGGNNPITGGSNVNSIAIAFNNTNIIYAGIIYEPGTSLYKSINAGVTWEVTSFSEEVTTIIINKIHSDTILVGTSSSGIKKSIDGGNTWLETNLSDQEINKLESDPIDQNTAYAGTEAGIYKTIDGGDTWVLLGLGSNDVHEICINEANPNIIYAGTTIGIYKSVDGGTIWQLFSSGITHLNIWSIEFGPEEKIIAGSINAGGGIFISSDEGDNWASSNTGLTALCQRFILLDPQNDNVIYAGTAGRGFQKSIDGGNTWQDCNNGLPQNATVMSGAIVPNNSNTIYSGIYDNCGYVNGIFKTTDSGVTWLPTSLNNKYVWAIDINPVETNIIYAGTYMDDIYKSIDGGDNWTTTGFGMGMITDIAIDPLNPSVIYVSDLLGDKVWKSENSGANWFQTGFLGEGPFCITIDPFDNTTIYLGGYRGVYKSTDSGTTFNLTSLGSLSAGATVKAIVIDPLDPNVIFAGARAGMGFWAAKVWKSIDAGETWTEFTNELPANTNVCDLAISYNSEQNIRTIYLGGETWGASLYAYSEQITAIEENDLAEDIGGFLSQNYPNPFNTKTTIQFTTADSDNNTEIIIFSFNGQKIKTLINKKLESGLHEVIWDGTDNSGNQISSGIYFYKLQNDNFNETKSMILIR